MRREPDPGEHLVRDPVRRLALQPLVELVETRRPGAATGEMLADLVGVRQARPEHSGQHAEPPFLARQGRAGGHHAETENPVTSGSGDGEVADDAPVRQVVHRQVARETCDSRPARRQLGADGCAGEHVIGDEQSVPPAQDTVSLAVSAAAHGAAAVKAV